MALGGVLGGWGGVGAPERADDAPDRGGAPSRSAALVLVPSSLVSNWLNELDKWMVCNVEALRASQKPEERLSILRRARRGGVDVVVASYELVASVEWAEGPDQWSVVIVDEVHGYKNPKTQRFVNFRAELSARARCVFGLTGTPLQNNLLELHTLLEMCTSYPAVDAKDFETQFAPIERARAARSTAFPPP